MPKMDSVSSICKLTSFTDGNEQPGIAGLWKNITERGSASSSSFIQYTCDVFSSLSVLEFSLPLGLGQELKSHCKAQKVSEGHFFLLSCHIQFINSQKLGSES